MLRAIPEVIDPKLFPFFLHSDQFMHRAVDISVGGLSPTINWTKLKKEEFLIPPKDQQAELAELLWAADDANESKLIVLQKIETAKESLISQHLSKIGKDDVECLTIADLAAKSKNSCCGGPFGSDLTGKDYVPEAGVPVIRGANLTKGGARFLEEEFVYVSKEKGQSLAKNSARRNDIIVTQRGTLGQVGLIPKTSKHETYIVSQSQMKLTVDPEVAMPEFVYYYLLSKNALRHLGIVTISTGVPHINLGIFKQFPIPVPPLAMQESIVKSLNQIDGTIDESQRNIFLSKGLTKSLINQIF
ncbi:MAG: restriction endonuclease subunit S [Verrucomicrobiales bacterium]|nr:restriction endonuclease subunit S [Verrucomicrobiales bacterium]